QACQSKNGPPEQRVLRISVHLAQAIMSSSKEVKNAIQQVIRRMMDRVMDNVLVNDPFVPEAHHAKKPLYAALVPDEIFKGSHFERRFTTPFGKAWETLAVVAAKEGLGRGEMGFRIKGNVSAERLRRIAEVLSRLEHGKDADGRKIKPDWTHEVQYIQQGGGELIPTEVECDVYAETKDGSRKVAFELKAPMPNSDQTKVSKEKLFKLYAMQPMQVTHAYFALPYNPYGRSRTDYQWSFPMRWFDMHRDPVVLIGDEFWDTIGGPGTYNAFLEAVNQLGR